MAPGRRCCARPSLATSRPSRRPGHNLFTYHKDPDGNVIELFTQIDRMTDGSKGYWEPRPWHETFPMYPKTWEIDALTANLWGPFDPSLLCAPS